jgi:hypothetical protein
MRRRGKGRRGGEEEEGEGRGEEVMVTRGCPQGASCHLSFGALLLMNY